MKYAIWFVRLLFAAWMIPAGLNHFIPLFRQPDGNMPLSKELFEALFDSGLFTLVKGVELIAGISVLTGLYTPLALVMCMPVSFCVWYWDTPLQGWGSASSIYGWAVLGCNCLLCLAYVERYKAMFARLAWTQFPSMKAPIDGTMRGGKWALWFLVGVAELGLGAWMAWTGANHFTHHHPELIGHTPLAIQLMSALVHSRLIDVACGIQLVAGTLLFLHVFVPLALCILMPISVCAAYWAVVLEREPTGAALALLAVALNAALMFAHIDSYRDMLVRHARTVGERDGNFESLFVDPLGRTGQRDFILALIPLALVAAFYHWLVFGGSGQYAMLILLFPAVILHARRLHDMGKTGWLLLIPAIPTAGGIWFHMYDKGQSAEQPAIWVALAISAAFMIWGLFGKTNPTPLTASS